MNRRAARLALGSMAAMCAPFLCIAFIGTWLGAPADVRVVTNLFVTIALVLALQTFVGTTGIVSFGHAGFMAIGAYATALLIIPPEIKSTSFDGLPHVVEQAHLSPIVAIAVGTALGAIVGALIGGVLARMPGGAMAMATLCVLIIVFVVFENWDQMTRGPIGIFGIPSSLSVWGAAAVALAVLGVARFFGASTVGTQLRASAADPIAAESMGSDVVRLRWLAWIVSAALMAAGGGAWASVNLAFSPEAFYFDQAFALLAMLILGGMYTTSGAVTGAIVIIGVQELVRRTVDVPGVTQLVIASGILVILYARPSGIWGRAELDARVKRWLAD